MSLEAAIQENTATMKQLIAVLAAQPNAISVELQGEKVGGTVETAGSAPETESAGKTTRKRGKKAEQPEQGAAEETRYFFNETTRALYMKRPGDDAVTGEGAREITKEEYDALKEQLAAEYKARQEAEQASATPPAATPAPQPATATPSADSIFGNAAPAQSSAPVITQQVVTEKLIELAKVKGNQAVMAICQELGAVNVPAIKEDDRARAYEMAVQALTK